MAQADFLIVPLCGTAGQRAREEEQRERERRVEQLKRALWRFDHCYVGSDSAFWDMVCSGVLGLEVR